MNLLLPSSSWSRSSAPFVIDWLRKHLSSRLTFRTLSHDRRVTFNARVWPAHSHYISRESWIPVSTRPHEPTHNSGSFGLGASSLIWAWLLGTLHLAFSPIVRNPDSPSGNKRVTGSERAGAAESWIASLRKGRLRSYTLAKDSWFNLLKLQSRIVYSVDGIYSWLHDSRFLINA